MSAELRPNLIDETDSIKLPRLFSILYINGSSESAFSISHRDDIEEDMVEHVYINPKTGENLVFMRQTLAEEIEITKA